MYESSIKPRRFFSVRKIKMYNEQHAKPAVDDVRNSRSVKSHSLMRTTMIARWRQCAYSVAGVCSSQATIDTYNTQIQA